MLTNRIWTITNETGDRLFWRRFRKDDTALWVGLADGFISAGDTIAVDVELVDQLKIEFKKDNALGDFVAKAQLVNTDRGVTINRDRKIVQGDAPEGRSDLLSADFMETGVTYDQLVSAARTLLLGLVKIVGEVTEVPVIGELVAMAIDLFWKEGDDLIAASEARMKEWVRGEIADYDRAFLKNTLSGLQANLVEYAHATTSGERRRWLDVCLSNFNQVQPYFLKEDYTIGTAALAFQVATLHLGLLYERLTFATQIFESEAVSLPQFKKELQQNIKAYQLFIKNVAVPAETTWRAAQLVTGKDTNSIPTIRDMVTREVHTFTEDVPRTYYLAQAKNSYAIALQKNLVDPSLLWSLLDPDQAATQPIALDRMIWVGPLSGLAFEETNVHEFTLAEVSVGPAGKIDKPATIKELVIRSADRVDCIQVSFKEGAGPLVGNKDGGAPVKVTIDDGAFITRVDTKWDWDLFEIGLGATGGKYYGRYGNRQGKTGLFTQSVSYPGHRVSALKIGARMQSLLVAFTPLPTYYADVDVKKAVTDWRAKAKSSARR